MGTPNLVTRAVLHVALAALLFVGAGATASAQTYVLNANSWGPAQDAAVAAAGGTVIWSHGPTGLAEVRSDDPGFPAAVRASGVFRTATLDFQVQWQPEVEAFDISEQVIDPSIEFLYPIQWHLPAVQAPDAWALGCTGDGARVAVLDGGIFNAHPDLAPNVDNGCSVSFVPGQAFNMDTGTFWHGTHVAGIVAAANSGAGVLGVAPEATIMGVKVLHSGSGSFGQVIGGILYASDPAAFGLGACARADIINMSLGAGFFKNQPGAGDLVSAMNEAVNFAGSRGVLVISAAGNNGVNVRRFPALTFVPADSGSGLAVSATGPEGWALGATNFNRPASYSNYGNGFIDLSAPGGDFVLPGDDFCTVAGITVPCWVFDMVLSTSRAGWSWAAGTSMAAPVVSGVAALIKAKHPNIPLGALKTRLFQTANRQRDRSFHGQGWVNALNACRR
jgi:subtilisin family serine protease